ncbi:uncharacterized protein LOC143025381 isoform X2 [Oratosquilla oratoria]|uniref:uncharacterized protein LOC143025381 isoform X2 n=1 Tax=Oratosquilla oratoria TaxID=337810 RepID=UPI003F76D138
MAKIILEDGSTSRQDCTAASRRSHEQTGKSERGREKRNETHLREFQNVSKEGDELILQKHPEHGILKPKSASSRVCQSSDSIRGDADNSQVLLHSQGSKHVDFTPSSRRFCLGSSNRPEQEQCVWDCWSTGNTSIPSEFMVTDVSQSSLICAQLSKSSLSMTSPERSDSFALTRAHRHAYTSLATKRKEDSEEFLATPAEDPPPSRTLLHRLVTSFSRRASGCSCRRGREKGQGEGREGKLQRGVANGPCLPTVAQELEAYELLSPGRGDASGGLVHEARWRTGATEKERWFGSLMETSAAIEFGNEREGSTSGTQRRRTASAAADFAPPPPPPYHQGLGAPHDIRTPIELQDSGTGTLRKFRSFLDLRPNLDENSLNPSLDTYFRPTHHLPDHSILKPHVVPHSAPFCRLRSTLHPAHYLDDLKVRHNIKRRELVSRLLYREGGQLYVRDERHPPPVITRWSPSKQADHVLPLSFTPPTTTQAKTVLSSVSSEKEGSREEKGVCVRREGRWKAGNGWKKIPEGYFIPNCENGGSPSVVCKSSSSFPKPLDVRIHRKMSSLRRVPVPEPSWTCNDFVSSCLKAHNLYRARHSAPPLKLSPELCSMAQAWVNHLAHTGVVRHRNLPDFGENLFCRNTALIARGSTSLPHPQPDISGEEVAAYWYSAVRQYKFNKPSTVLHAHAGNVADSFHDNVLSLNTRALKAEMENAGNNLPDGSSPVKGVLGAQPLKLTGRTASKALAAQFLGHVTSVIKLPDNQFDVVIHVSKRNTPPSSVTTTHSPNTPSDNVSKVTMISPTAVATSTASTAAVTTSTPSECGELFRHHQPNTCSTSSPRRLQSTSRHCHRQISASKPSSVMLSSTTCSFTGKCSPTTYVSPPTSPTNPRVHAVLGVEKALGKDNLIYFSSPSRSVTKVVLDQDDKVVKMGNQKCHRSGQEKVKPVDTRSEENSPIRTSRDCSKYQDDDSDYECNHLPRGREGNKEMDEVVEQQEESSLDKDKENYNAISAGNRLPSSEYKQQQQQPKEKDKGGGSGGGLGILSLSYGYSSQDSGLFNCYALSPLRY